MSAHAIRQVGLPDRAVLGAAVERFGDQQAADEWITAFVASQQSFAFVAVDADDELIGWAWGWQHRRPDGPPVARLEALVVEASRRRRGVGSMLFDAVFAHARRLRCQQLILDVSEPLGVEVEGFLDSLRSEISPTNRVRWAP